MANRPYLPLEQFQPGSRGIVRELEGGKGIASRLAAMGLTVGAYIEVLENRGHGPLLVLVRDTRIALGRSRRTTSRNGSASLNVMTLVKEW